MMNESSNLPLVFAQAEQTVWAWSPTTLGTLLTGLSVFVSSVLLALSMRQLGRSQQAGVADHKRRAMGETQKQLLKMNKDNVEGMHAISTALGSRSFLPARQAEKLLAAKWGDGQAWKTSQAIRDVLLRMDSMALGVTMGLLDIEVVWRSQGREILAIQDSLRYYIAAVQQDSSDQFRNFEALVDKLDGMHKREMVDGVDRGHGGLVGVEGGQAPPSVGRIAPAQLRSVGRLVASTRGSIAGRRTPTRRGATPAHRGAVQARRGTIPSKARMPQGRGSSRTRVSRRFGNTSMTAVIDRLNQLGSRAKGLSSMVPGRGTANASAMPARYGH